MATELGISCELYAHINIFLSAGHAPCESLHCTDTIQKAKEGKIRKLSFYHRGQKVKGAQAGPSYVTLRFSFTKFPLQTHAARGQQDGSQVHELAARPNLRIPTLEPMWWKGRTLNSHTRWSMSAPRQIQKKCNWVTKKSHKKHHKMFDIYDSGQATFLVDISWSYAAHQPWIGHLWHDYWMLGEQVILPAVSFQNNRDLLSGPECVSPDSYVDVHVPRLYFKKRLCRSN